MCSRDADGGHQTAANWLRTVVKSACIGYLRRVSQDFVGAERLISFWGYCKHGGSSRACAALSSWDARNSPFRFCGYQRAR